MLNSKFCYHVEFSIQFWFPSDTLQDYSEPYKIPLINKVATNLTYPGTCNFLFPNLLNIQKPSILGSLNGHYSFFLAHNWELMRSKCPYEIAQDCTSGTMFLNGETFMSDWEQEGIGELYFSSLLFYCYHNWTFLSFLYFILAKINMLVHASEILCVVPWGEKERIMWYV